jgi:hypothetical protein
MLGFIYLTSLSAVLGVMALVILYRRIALRFSGIITEGSFVRWEESDYSQNGLRQKLYSPVISFQARDGEVYEFVGGPATSSARQKKSYKVLYPAQDPQKAMNLSLLAYWAAPFAFFILSGAAAFAAVHQPGYTAVFGKSHSPSYSRQEARPHSHSGVPMSNLIQR